MEQQEVKKSNRNLIVAFHNRDYDAVNDLLERGSNANEVDDTGSSALHRAVMFNDFKMIELLLRHNAQVDIENNDGWRPLDYAILFSRTDIIIYFILQYKQEVRSSNIDFVASSEEEYPENINKLLYENVNLEDADSYGYTALHYAVKFNDLYGIKTLISRGVDVNKVTAQEGSTPLHLARSTECIKILLRAGAEPNLQNAYSYSPLCEIMLNSDIVFIERKERRGMIEELIRNGADCIEVINHSLITDSPELIYRSEDVLRFMVLKEHEHHKVNINNLELNRRQFYRHCLNEVVLLKEKKLLDYLTYYDFAAKSIHELSKYVTNKCIKKAFKNKSKLTCMFPIYSEILWSHFEEATEERKVREAACLSLSYAIPCINAGHIVTYKILNFLEIEDIKNILEAFPSAEIQNNK